MNREPRVLLPSDGLLRALALCGGTSVKRLRGSRKQRAKLSLVALERLEEEIDARLHEDILVLLAVRDPVLRLLTGIGDINDMSDAADDESPAPEGYVRIAMVYSDPIGELVFGSHGGPYYEFAVKRKPEGDEARLLVCSDGLWEEAEEITVADFVERVLDEARAGETQEAVVLGSVPDRPPPLAPPAELVSGRRLPRASKGGEKVSHPKFGVGEVLKRVEAGEHEKVLVRFADTERTILARFVKPWSEGGSD